MKCEVVISFSMSFGKALEIGTLEQALLDIMDGPVSDLLKVLG